MDLMLGPIIFLFVLVGSLVSALVLLGYPEVAIILYLVLVSGLVPNQLNPYIDLLIGNFQVSDLILISLLALIFIRRLLVPGFRFRKTPLDLPIILFCVAIFISMATAVFSQGIRFSYTTYEARILLSYAMFFPVTNLIRTKVQLKRVIFGLFVIGFLVATLVVLQTILGPSVTLVYPGFFKADILLRAYHPGYPAAFITMMSLISLLAAYRKNLPLVVIYLVLIVSGLSILFSLGRNILISSLISFVVLMYVLREQRTSRLVSVLVFLSVISIVGFLGLTIFASDSVILAYAGVLGERLSNLFSRKDLLSPDETLLWRIREIEYTWTSIKEYPVLGIGLVTPYRPEFYAGDTLRNYIHNGYLWVWLKAGLIGLIPYLWFLFLALVRGFRRWSWVSNELFRAVSLGFTLVLLAMLFSNLVAPFFVQEFSLAFFALIMGINELIFSGDENISEVHSAS